MKRALTAAILITLGGATAALAAPALAPPSATVSVKLPGDAAGPAFKPGPGVQTAATYCLTCHSAAYVATQPVLSRAQWTGEITKMRAVYAATIPDAAVAPLIEYLVTQYGKP